MRPRFFALSGLLALAVHAGAAPKQDPVAEVNELVRNAGKLPPTLPGWDSCKWNDPAHQTPKYTVGRIVASYPHTPNGLKAAVPAIAGLFPGSKISDKHKDGDRIEITCVGVIDMVVNAAGPDQGDRWAWQVNEDWCGKCKPNRCEEVSKAKNCGGGSGGGGSGGGGSGGGGSGGGGSGGGGSGGGGSGGGGSGGGGSGGGGSGGGGSAGWPDRRDAVAEAKAELEAAGKDLHSSCGAYSIVKRAVWKLKDTGAGLLSKPGGNNCEAHSVDIIVYPDGRHYDVLGSSGEENRPMWHDAGFVDRARWRAPIDPGPLN